MRLGWFLPTLVLVARPAFAESVPGGEVRLERSADAQACPTEAEFVRATLALGAAPDRAAAEPLSIAVRFEGSGTGLRAIVSSTGPKTGERELRTEGPDCTKLAEAAAVVVAVLLDIVPPEAVASFEPAPRAVPAAPALPAPIPAPPPPPPQPIRAPESPGAPTDLALRAEAALGVGLLGAALSPTLGGAARVGHGRVELALGGAWVAPRRVHFAPIPGTRVDVFLALGYAEGCWRLALGGDPWRGAVCAHAAAGALTVRGRYFDDRASSRQLWLAAGPAFALSLELHRLLALRASALGLVTLGRRRFEVSGYGDAFETSPAAAAVTLGPELLIF
jgi:hypothetical protein